jgi:hypothetical protein
MPIDLVIRVVADSPLCRTISCSRVYGIMSKQANNHIEKVYAETIIIELH